MMNEEWEKIYDEGMLRHIEKIPNLSMYWMGKGRLILSEKYWQSWDEIVPIRLHDLYRGRELGNCLDIVKILNDGGTFDEAEKEINEQDHSGISFGLVCSMVVNFSDRGLEFVKHIRK